MYKCVCVSRVKLQVRGLERRFFSKIRHFFYLFLLLLKAILLKREVPYLVLYVGEYFVVWKPDRVSFEGCG